MNKYLYLLRNIIYIIRYSKAYSKGKYDYLIELCEKRYSEKPDDFLLNRVLAYSYYKKNELGKSYIYFWQLVKINSQEKIQSKFIQIFIYPLWKNKKYSEVIVECEKLFLITKRNVIKKQAIKLLIASYYHLGQNRKVKEIANKTLEDYHSDYNLLDYVRKYYEPKESSEKLAQEDLSVVQ